MDYKALIALLSAMLTPTIAVITTYIAIQQFRSNRLKQRLELYDRRLAVYNATMKFIRGAAYKNDWSDQSIDDFLAATEVAEFLFDKDVTNYLSSVYAKVKGLEIMAHDGAIDPSSIISVRENARAVELTNWLSNQQTSGTPGIIFSKYLNLKKLR